MAERETEQEYLKRNDAYLKAAAILQPYTLHHEAMFMYHPDLLEQVIQAALSCGPRGRKLQRVEWAARRLREKMAREGKTKEVASDADSRQGTDDATPGAVAQAPRRPRHRRAGG